MEKIMTFAKLFEGLNLIKTRMKVLEDIDLDDQRVAMIRKSLEKYAVTWSF